MSKKKDSLILQFKNEYKARLQYDKRIKELEDKILLLESKMAVHSPNLTGTAGTPQSRDEKMAEYLTKKAKYEDELFLLNKQAEKVDAIISKMDRTVAFHLYHIYKGNYTIEHAGEEMGLSRPQMKWRIDEEIVRAYKKWSKG